MHHCKNNGRNFDSLSPEHLTGCTLWLKKRVFNPAASSNIALWLKINIFNPKYSLHTPFQGLSGIKSRLSESTTPSRCRLLGLQVRSRSAQHSVLSRSAASRCLSSPSAPLVPPPSGGRGAKAGCSPRDLLQEHKEYCCHQTGKGSDVIPLQALTLEQKVDDYGKDHQRDNLLNHFQLHKREGPSVDV